MANRIIKSFFINVVLFLMLLLTGCGSDTGGRNAGTAIPSAGQNSVDAVLQQQKAEADRKKAVTDKGGDAGADRTGPDAPVSAKRMKELEEIIPRHDVYDSQLTYTKVDYDFSRMNKNMMYLQIYNMLKTPDEYKGKVVRMQGTFGHYYDEKTGKHYFGCVVVDATACCATGMEFSRKGQRSYPENYPKIDEPIVVTGRFASYKEGKEIFCELEEAEIEKL